MAFPKVSVIDVLGVYVGVPADWAVLLSVPVAWEPSEIVSTRVDATHEMAEALPPLPEKVDVAVT